MYGSSGVLVSILHTGSTPQVPLQMCCQYVPYLPTQLQVPVLLLLPSQVTFKPCIMFQRRTLLASPCSSIGYKSWSFRSCVLHTGHGTVPPVLARCAQV